MVSGVRTGRTDWEVVVETSDGAGVVRENSLGCQEWVELDWSALLRRRPPLDERHERPERFTLDRSLAVVDSVVDGLDGLDRLDRLDGLYNWLSDVMSMLRLWLNMMGPMCGMLSMVGSMGGMFSRVMIMMAVVVVMIVTISRGQGEDH